MIITVFGGANLKEGQTAYEDARQLGYSLGKAGHELLTGGYTGVMEAVSRGGHEAGAKVIGATCVQIEKWHADRRPNPYLDEEWRFETLQERLFALIQRSDAAVAMPGGIGTLAEIATMWNEIVIQSIPPHPLILFGASWQQMISQFYAEFESYVPDHDRGYVRYAKDVAAVVEMLQALQTHQETRNNYEQ